MSFNMANMRFPYCVFLSLSFSFATAGSALRQSSRAAKVLPRAQLEERRKAGIYERYSAARMQTSINKFDLVVVARRHDRSVASWRAAARRWRGQSGNAEETTMQKRANWIATRGTARRSCMPSQWRMCEKIPPQWWTRRRVVSWKPWRGHRVGGVNAGQFRERIERIEDTASDVCESVSWGF